MNTNHTIEKTQGIIWHLLHSERETVCEALLRNSSSHKTVDRQLQVRLTQIDDALDRLNNERQTGSLRRDS